MSKAVDHLKGEVRGKVRALINRREELLAQITWAARELGIVGRELDALTREKNKKTN
ncbi:MAG: hypothetical protein H0T78_02330 [Longispora sp.]|nr:hypothetical protein [Longispora sp. (in: high G+C Gram-positive bacteria)]